MYKFKKNIVPIILVLIMCISSFILFLVSAPVENTAGDLVLQSDLELMLQDASTLLLVVSAIASIAYIHTEVQLKPYKKVNSYTPKHVMYRGRD